VAFIGVLHQPTRQRTPLKRVTRLVVLPDYQGIGIGRAFLDAVAEMYARDGFEFEIKTSARNLVSSLKRDARWRMAYYGFAKDSRHQLAVKKLKARKEVKAATFFWRSKRG
jgi:GNAT superfamily N-acetyltransferase